MGRPFHRQKTALYTQSFLFLSKWTLGLATLSVGIAAAIQRNLPLLIVAGICAGLFAACFCIYLLEGQRTRCAVCSTPLFGLNKNLKHKHAKRLFGSYKLRISRDVLLFNRYQCPNCNERVTCSESERNKAQTARPQKLRTLPTMRESNKSIAPVNTLADGNHRVPVSPQPDDSPTLPA